MHTDITNQSGPVCRYASMPESTDSVKIKKSDIVIANAPATGHHQKSDHATKNDYHQHTHGLSSSSSSPSSMIIKYPCNARHQQHFPCVYTILSTAIAQENVSVLPFPKDISSTIGFDHNDAFDFDNFRAAKDRHLNQSPLYKHLMKHNINPIKVYIKPFLKGTPHKITPSIESPASLPSQSMAMKNEDQFSPFNDWKKYYPQPLKTFSSSSTLYLTNSQISSLLASTFSSQQSFRSCTSSHRATSDIQNHHQINNDTASHHHSSDEYSTGDENDLQNHHQNQNPADHSTHNDDTTSKSESKSDGDTRRKSESKSKSDTSSNRESDDDHDKTQQKRQASPLLGAASGDYLPPSLSAHSHPLQLQIGKPIHSISSLRSRAKKGLKTINKLGKPSIKKGKTPTRKSLPGVEKNSTFLGPSLQSSSKSRKISPSIIANRRASLRSKVKTDCPPP